MAAVMCDELQSETYFALGYASSLRRSLRDFWHYRRSLDPTIRHTKALLRILQSNVLDSILKDDPDNAFRIVESLGYLHSQLTAELQIARSKGLDKRLLVNRRLATLQRNNETLGEVLESLRFAINNDFRTTIDKAVSQLNTTAAPRDWRSSLAEMRD